MRRKDIMVAWLAVAVLSGCGDGGLTDPPDGDTPIDPGVPGGGGPASTSGQRGRALDAVQVLMSALPGQNFAAETTVLVSAVKSMPQFADAGASPDGTVWARFTDGTLLFIAHAPPPDAPGAAAGSAAAGSASHDGRGIATGARLSAFSSSRPGVGAGASTRALAYRTAAAVRTFPGDVPKSEKYRLFDAMGSYFVPDVRADLAAMLDANGYRGTREPATIHALRSVSGDGIFYIRSHGGFGSVKRDGGTKDFYALWTATAAMDSTSEAADAVLLDDLKNNRVVYMLFRASRWSRALPVLSPERHYGITQDFVSHYMTFSDNSLVYIDACSSSVLPGFRAGFTTASAYVGWSERAAFEQMGPTAKYVFDRLLGANRFEAEDPRQRPFEFDGLTADPRFGHGRTYGFSRVVQDAGPVEADLTFHQLRGSFGLLAPSIWAVTPDEINDRLEILGSFGSDPGADGRVTIDSGSGPVQLSVLEWTPTHLRANLPPTGPGSYGNVMVETRGHLSNARQLFAWEGTLLYTLAEAGSLTQRFELDLRVRADPQDVRDEPGEAPKATLTGPFLNALGMEARFAAGGSYSTPVGPCTSISDWAGHGTITTRAAQNPTGATYIYGGTVAKRRAEIEVVIGASHPSGLQATGTLRCPDGTQSGTYSQAIGVDTRVHGGTNGTSTFLALPLDGTLNVPAGGRQIQVPSMVDPSLQASIRVSWSGLTARPAYDARLAR